MKKNKFKQITIGLVAGVTLLTAVSPVSVAFADVSNQTSTAQNVSDNEPLSENFISKYDSAIKLENNKFVLNQNLLPQGTSQDDIAKLNEVIKASNLSLEQQFKDVPKENISKTNNSVVFAENATVAQQEASGIRLQARIAFKEGSNYSHTYWWGKRVGVSRSKVRQVSGVINSSAGVIAGVLYFIPHPYAKAAAGAIGAAAGVLGYPMAKFPGGIVFNTTPNYLGSQIWSVAFQ
ncbi:hypothetical protein V6B05_02405 [Lactococcus garvieae]|uniref:hypothetical protein n=1 Tax=Lactococcus garvieae TaxID=1363 RepID=UPI001F608303|nr:hypothetical protein [Lactococcus garvieae]MCI3860253.1 hypothetical protein [Lactococcus garvieae]